VDYLIQGCAAMVEAHTAGIVHRDLKPANMFLTTGSDGAPVIKVLDFGISKLSVPDITEASLTRTSVMMGSPYYMSPEQMKSARSVDHRADIWALGVILFELLAGQPPFGGETLPELIANIMTDAPLDVRQHRPEVPPELEAVIAKCLQKDRDQRYQSIAELAQALAPFATRATAFTLERISKIAGGGQRASSLPPPQSVEAPVMAGTATNWSETNKPGQTEAPAEKKTPKVALLAAALALVGAAGGVGAWLTMSSTPDIEPDRALSAPEEGAAHANPAGPAAPEKADAPNGGEIVPVVPSEEPTEEALELESSETTQKRGPEAVPAKEPRAQQPKPAAKKPTAKPVAAPRPAAQAPKPVATPVEDKPAATKMPAPPKNPLAIELK
jgi:serine/threonine-protein kinase